MFTKGLRGGRLGRLGEFVNQDRKVEYWLPNTFGSQASIIPGVSNTTAAVAGGGIAAALAAAAAAWFFLKK
jgi:hypothetical protein